MSSKKEILMILAILVALLIGLGGVFILEGGEGILVGILLVVVGVIGALLINYAYEKS